MAGSDQIWPEALRTLEEGKSFTLATVINVRGSTPREVGAKMIVRDDGQFGTIGGGCGEAEVYRKARILLEEGGTACLAEVDLTGDFEQQEIGTCGGIMDVFLDSWSPRSDLPLARKLAEAARQSRPAALVTLVESGKAADSPPGTRTVVDAAGVDHSRTLIELPAQGLADLNDRTRAGVPGLLEVGLDGKLHNVMRIESSGATRLFLDPVVGAQRLIIAGAGHIAQPLCVLGSLLGFHVTVIDDRAAFANRERFPGANNILVRPFAEAIDSIKLDRHCYLVSVTRGHAFDEEVVRTALKQPGAFVGMIGSRRRVKTTLERLAEEGIAPERLEQVHAPLGVDIGAETPEEIAVSIMAEIIRERRTGLRDAFNLGTKLGRLKRMTTGELRASQSAPAPAAGEASVRD